MDILSTQEFDTVRREALAQTPIPAPEDRYERNVRIFRLKKGEQVQLQADSACYLSVVRGAAEVAQGDDSMALSQAATGRPYVARRGRGTTVVTASENSVVLCGGGDMLDTVTAWAVLTNTGAGRTDATQNRMARLCQSRAFRRVPMECVEMALGRMGERKVAAGEEIVRQGEPGDAFYVIWSGRAEVWQTGLYDDAPVKVAELEEGDAFGEEALVTGGTRNATVKMISDGKLLVLPKEDFHGLLASPLIQEVNPAIAKAMAESGVQWIDVRYEEEYADSHIPGAIHIPLHELRDKAPALLTPDQRYVVYCRSGKRSRVGALLLAQRGYQAVSMQGGLIEWPHEVQSLS
jgi:rhodanese-related sulfurtransferase